MYLRKRDKVAELLDIPPGSWYGFRTDGEK